MSWGLSRRTGRAEMRKKRADGYGGTSADSWEQCGVVEPDQVNLPGTATPHEKVPQIPPLRKARPLNRRQVQVEKE